MLLFLFPPHTHAHAPLPSEILKSQQNHPFLDQPHREWWEQETSFSTLLFIWGLQKWGSPVSWDSSTFIHKVCCRAFSCPGTPQSNLQSLCLLGHVMCTETRQDEVQWVTGLILQALLTQRSVVHPSWQHHSCSSNPAEQPNDDNHAWLPAGDKLHFQTQRILKFQTWS